MLGCRLSGQGGYLSGSSYLGAGSVAPMVSVFACAGCSGSCDQAESYVG